MKILATIKKELLTLWRDPAGLLLIFLMPMVMVTVMSLVQDAPFRDYTQFSFDIICVNNDQDSIGSWFENSLESAGTFKVHHVYEGKKIDPELAQTLVHEGKFKAAIIIPPKTTMAVNSGSHIAIQTLLAGFGMGDKPTDSISSTPKIQLLFDPVTKANFRQSLLFAMEKMTAALQTKLLMQQLNTQMSALTGQNTESKQPFQPLLTVEEVQPHNKQMLTTMNSVQHNVPGWTMFAMFFILFPLAGNFIKEREDGSLLRMRLVAGSQLPYIFGKYVFHWLICILQFFLMLLVGLYILPAMGLSKLVIGDQAEMIVVAAVFIAFAATAFGLFVGVFFKTHHQALAFGSVSVVLLAAIGGVWVPAYVMPPVMKVISSLSPMSWGMELCNNIFLRQTRFSVLVPSVVKLTAFGMVCLGLSFLIHTRRFEK
ncbi:MAG: ABC transporter permease [Chitinophagales bacterium]